MENSEKFTAATVTAENFEAAEDAAKDLDVSKTAGGEASEGTSEEEAESGLEDGSEDGSEATGGTEEDYSEDLCELVEFFPHLRRFGSPCELDGGKRYAELRKMGLSPKEAYLAVGGMSEIERCAEVERQRDAKDGLAHIRATVSGGRTPRRIMSDEQRRAAKITLGDGISDAELDALWKRVFDGE